VSVTSFRFKGNNYTISTTTLDNLKHIQRMYDEQAGYTGPLGNYETMLFIDGESMVYPFGNLPGHVKLGVFQRHETEEEARDGHQQFVTLVQKELRMCDERIDWKQWADEQLQGVMRRDDPRYHFEVQMMELVCADYEMMLLHEQGVFHPHVASEYEPRSWAWLL